MSARLMSLHNVLHGGPHTILLEVDEIGGAQARGGGPSKVFQAGDAMAIDVTPVARDIATKPSVDTLLPGDSVTKAPRDAFAPVETPAADTVPGDISTAATIAVGAGVEVVIDTPGDSDWYAVTLTGGVTYTFQTQRMVGGGNPDSLLTLRDATGADIAQDDDGGDGTYSLLSYTPTLSGTYYIDASTYSGGGQSSSGSYRLFVSTGPTANGSPDSVGASTGTAGSIAVGGAINGRINSNGDHDWYAITLTAGETYVFRTAGVTASTTTDTTLALRDAAGTQILFDDDGGGDAFSGIRYTATTSGTYYLDVGAFGTGTGNFSLTAFTSALPPLYTNDQIRTQLTTDFWNGAERHFNVAPGGTITVNILNLTAAGQTLAREALALWSDATGITFSEVAAAANITFDDNQEGAFANSTRVGNIIQSSTVNVGTEWLTAYGTGLNTYSFQTYIHEIGHALGLGHGGNYNGSAAYLDADYQNDAWATTIMSYFDQQENTYFAGQGFTRQFALTPLVADILATTYLYGTPSTTRTGDTTYGFNNNSGRAIFDATQFPSVTYTVVDHGGIDTLDYSGFSQNQRIDLNQEAFSNVGGRVGNVTIARGSVIENAVGGTGNDTIIGNNAANVIDLRFGGDDTVQGGGGSDGFYFGAAFTAADSVDGGTGTDQIGLQGNYNLTLGANSTVGVEQIVLLAGNDTRFNGQTGTNLSYNITTVDANVAAGQVLTFQANTLRAGESFTLDASAETNGSILTFGGLGTETITGGQMGDGFYFGTGRFNAGDTVNGGGGSDQIGFQGNFAGGNALFFGASQLTSIEFIVLMSANDTRFGGGNVGQSFSYEVFMNDGNVAAGQRMIISANRLSATEALTFYGTAETDGSFQIFSGAGNDLIEGSANADDIWGGAGADRIIGRGGADTLRGGAGNDTFVYTAFSDSLNSARDTIFDFTLGDRIDISSLGSFSFIGAGPQTSAFQVQVVQSGNNAQVFVYFDGDANADMAINVTVTDGHTLTAADFAGVSAQEPIKLDEASVFQPAFDPLHEPQLWEVRHDPYLDLHGLGRDMVIV